MEILFKDGVRYLLYTYSDEDELERMEITELLTPLIKKD